MDTRTILNIKYRPKQRLGFFKMLGHGAQIAAQQQNGGVNFTIQNM